MVQGGGEDRLIEGEVRRAGRLLVVDDSPTMRVLQRVTLEEQGYHVITAKDGAEGLEMFLSSP